MIGRALTPIVDEDMESEVLFNDRHLVVAGSRNKWVGRRKIKIAEAAYYNAEFGAEV